MNKDNSLRNKTVRQAQGPKCLDCNDFGYTLAWNVAADYPREIPAGVVFAHGKPCHCESGQQFAAQQAEWRKPVPPRAA